MKYLKILVIGLLYSLSIQSQDIDEFEKYSNYLIYSPKTMAKLSHIVDSLNLKYKSCNFNTTFYSTSQTIGHLVTLNKGNIKKAKIDMENKMPLEEFLIKYPEASIKRNILILKSKFKNYQGENIVKFKHFSLTSNYGFNIQSQDLSLFQKDVSNSWLLEYEKKTKYSKESLKAFYFPKDFSSVPIPQKYSQMIGYSDCLIDTTTTKFKDNLESGWVSLPKNWENLSDKKKAKLLDEMRSTRVMRMCSMDNRPRVHAKNIALLSAETAKWEVF